MAKDKWSPERSQFQWDETLDGWLVYVYLSEERKTYHPDCWEEVLFFREGNLEMELKSL